MKKIIKFLLTLIIICLVNVATFSLNYSKTKEVVEILTNDKLLVVRGKLNDKDAYFLLDTGSGLTILNSKRNKKYEFGLLNSNGYSIKGFGGNNAAKLYSTSLLDLKIGEVKLVGEIFATDIDHIASHVRIATGFEIVGIIGADIMHKYGFVIDYGNKKIFI